MDVATDELVEQHLPLVRRVAKKVRCGGTTLLDRDDLLTHGCLAVMEAAQRFDPERGVTFETFATQRIRGAMLDAIREVDWVPRTIRRRQSARHRGEPVEATSRQMHENGQVVSIETPLQDCDEQLRVADILIDRSASSERPTIDTAVTNALHAAIAALPSRLAFVLDRYFYDGATLDQIADELGVTEGRVCQMKREAFERLHGLLYEWA
jgi:RNA polymerase sigma factor for flagellar operon FliA